MLRPGRRIALASLPLLAAACGTTVSTTAAGAPVTGPGSDSLSVPSGAPGASAGSAPATGSGLGGGLAGGSAATGNGGVTAASGIPTSGSTPGGSVPGTSGGVAFSGPGLTATSITVGLSYATNTKAAGAALGVTNVNTGDPLAEQKAVIKDINDHGGIGGRKLRYVAHEIDATSTETYSQQAQEECAELTQDNKVFAVLDDFGGDTLRTCVAKAGAVQLTESAQSFTSASTYQKFPYFVLPASIRQDRIASAWTPALLRQHFFAKWNIATGKPGAMPVRVGVLTLDNVEDNYAIDHVLAPALKAAGYPVIDVARVKDPQGTSDNGATLSQIQNAVLKFRSDRITHFLPLDSAAGLSLYFGKNASSQHYYPRYGLNTGDGIQVLIDAGLMPTDQLNGAVGYGWEPFLDIDSGHNPDKGPYSNASRRHCIAVMKSANIDISGAPATRGALEYCDAFYFFKAAVEAGGPALTRDTFLAGVNALHGSFVAGTTFRTFLDPAHHDGIAAVRDFHFVNGCGCFLYNSPLRLIV